MTRALALLGIALRLARCRALIHRGRLDEARRMNDAIGRDLARLRA